MNPSLTAGWVVVGPLHGHRGDLTPRDYYLWGHMKMLGLFHTVIHECDSSSWFLSCIKTNGSVHTTIRAGFRMRFSICESPELQPPSYFLDNIRCQLSRRRRGIAFLTRRILWQHSSTCNLCAAVVLSWFCCVLKLLQHGGFRH
jgi:hypothetical protein